MKIAILSDIHGNDVAFEAAVEDAKIRGAERFVIAGDLISDYPLFSQVIARTRALTQLVVKGNREKYFEKYHFHPESGWREYKHLAALRWSFDRMLPDEFAYLFQLPEQISIPLNNSYSMLVAHQSPSNVWDTLDPEGNPADVEKAMSAITETVLVCGHSHRPCVKWVGGKLFVNPGSVGVNYSGSIAAEYALMDYTDTCITAEIMHVPYDMEVLWGELEKSGMMEDESAVHWINLIYRAQLDGKNYFSEFFQEAERLKAVGGYLYNDLPNEIWEETVAVFKQRKIL